MKIYIMRNWQEFGPYTFEETEKLLQDGKLLATDLAWIQGSNERVSLEDILKNRSLLENQRDVPDAKEALVRAAVAARQMGGAVAQGAKAILEGRDDKGTLGYSDALLFPFRQHRWKERIWWLSLVGFIPILGLIVLRGWRLDVVRRFSRDDARLLPDYRKLARFIYDGSVLWTMTLIYTAIPFLIIFSAGSGVLTSLSEIASWCMSFLKDEERMAFTALVAQEGSRLASRLAIETVYFVVAWPVYRAGMIRYAATGKVFSFFRIFGNIHFVLSNMREFIKMGLYVIPSWIVVALLSTLLAATGFGAVLVPAICIPLYYWTTAFEYGHLVSILMERLDH